MLEYMLDNELVAMKDAIIDLIDNDKHDEAVCILKFVKPLWTAANYGYKYNELRERGIVANECHNDCAHWKRIQSLKAIQNKYRSL
jgi:hypothetical protein